jgi:proteasome lid subunit RPN8/RPN11
MIQFTPEQREQMAAHGERTYPHECCGILIGRREGAATRATTRRRTAT